MNNEHYNIGLLSMNSPHPLGYFESLPNSPAVREQVMSTLLLYAGGAGVREGGHLQTGQTTSRGQQGAR